LRITGASATNFTANTSTINVSPTTPQTVNLNFAGTTGGSKSANLEIYNANGTTLSIPLTGYVHENTGCLAASVSSINIQSGNTDVPKEAFFTLSNTSLNGSVTINNVSFSGANANLFSYETNLVSPPTTLNYASSTGFVVKFNGNSTNSQTFTSTLVFNTNNPQCPSLQVPVTTIYTPTQLSWVYPTTEQTLEYTNSGLQVDLKWQGFIQADFPNIEFQYTYDNGITWTSILDPQGISNCFIHDNNIQNTRTTLITNSNIIGKNVQFRMRPCNINLAWQYSGIIHVINPSEKTIEVAYPNGDEVLTGGTVVNVKWRDFIGYGLVNLFYSTNSGDTYQTIALNVNAKPGFYKWNVPTGIKSQYCKIKIVAANIFDESDLEFSIQPIVNNPIQLSNITTFPEGCGNTSQGSATINIIGGVPTYYIKWIEAGINQISFNGISISTSGLKSGINHCKITDGNNNQAVSPQPPN
jgi:hypothetical protein